VDRLVFSIIFGETETSASLDKVASKMQVIWEDILQYSVLSGLPEHTTVPKAAWKVQSRRPC
jgi:hypothetical protein